MSLLHPLFLLLFILPLLIIAYFGCKDKNLKYVFIFVFVFLTDLYLQLIGQTFLDVTFIQWNWMGKILTILFAITFVLFQPKEHREEMGFTVKFDNKTLRTGVIAFIIFLLIDATLKWNIFPEGAEFELEAFMFQMIMPGLSEEIFYRGIYLWLLEKAFVSKKEIKGVKFGWGFILVTVIFGLAHGVILTESLEVRFDIATIIYLTLIPSLALGLLRKFSGNLLAPIVGHNLINVMNIFIRMR